MSKEQKLVPKMRFKEFEDSQPWQNKVLGDMVNFYSGLTYSPGNIVEEPGTLVIRSSNVKNGEIVSADNVYVDSAIANSENVQIGDIIVVVRNGSRHLIGKNAQVKIPMENTVIGAFMTGIRSKTSKFINALLDTKNFQIEIYKDLGATINQITTGNLRKMKFNFPNEDEANRIGIYFEKIDNLIISQRKKINKVKNIKSAYLSEMFPKEGEKYPKKRFEGFKEPWKEYSLGEVGNLYQPQTISRTSLQSSGIPVFGANGYIGYYSNANHEKDQITISARGENAGNPSYVVGPVWITGNSMVVNVDENTNINKKYLYSYLSSQRLEKYITGGAQPQLTRDVLNKVPIQVPSFLEQEKIGQFFKNLDNQISIEEKKLAKLENLKQGYLNDMFV